MSIARITLNIRTGVTRLEDTTSPQWRKDHFSESKLATEYLLQNSQKQNKTKAESSPLISK
eukprot:scaffold10525_cov120-Skeletonema_menzelii.AAC.1